MASTIQVRVDDELKRKSDIKKNSRAEYSPYNTMTEEEIRYYYLKNLLPVIP